MWNQSVEAGMATMVAGNVRRRPARRSRTGPQAVGSSASLSARARKDAGRSSSGRL